MSNITKERDPLSVRVVKTSIGVTVVWVVLIVAAVVVGFIALVNAALTAANRMWGN